MSAGPAIALVIFGVTATAIAAYWIVVLADYITDVIERWRLR